MPFQTAEVTRPLDVNTDLSEYELPPQTWSQVSNVDFNDFRSNRVKGATQVFDSPLAIQPLFAMSWNDGVEDVWLFGNDDPGASTGSIYKINAASTEVQMGSTYTTAFIEAWQGNVFNGVAIMNNGIEDPQYSDTATTMVDLSNWPANTVCSTIRPFKNFLIAMDITTVSVNFPARVLWSSPADAGTVPPSWDVADPAQQAGQFDLADTPGRCIDGKSLGDSFLIYKEDSVWSMDFIGGTFVFQFRKIFDDTNGILTRGCVAEFEGRHFVLTRGDAYIHDGTTKKSIMSARVSKAFFDSVDDTFFERTRVVADHANQEIWIYYVPSDEPTGLAQRALVWNWESDAWSFRELNDIAYIAEGPISEGASNAWDDDSQVWDDDTTAWDSQAESPATDKLLAAEYTNSKFLELNKGTTFDGVSYTTTLEKIGVDFGDDTSWKKINAIYPHFKGPTGTSVNIFVGHEDPQNSGVTYEGPFPFVLGSDVRINCRVNGRNIALKVESTEDAIWSLTGYTVEWTPTGARR